MASIVDYLKQSGKDSSYNARKKMAEQYGISGYSGTAAQNTQLLNALKNNPSQAPALNGGGGGASQQVSKNVTQGIETDSKSPLAQAAERYYNSNRQSGKSYTMSDTVRDYRDRLQDYEDDEPDKFQSKYTEQIDSILDSILNRPEFSYTGKEMNADPLYQMYKDSYMRQGNLAMRDTMANASALTGGYGNTYAQAAGQQAYDAYLSHLNDKALDFYDRAYQKYRDQGNDLYNQMNVVTGLDNTDYQRYRDEVSDYFTNRDYYNNRYNQEYGYDYGKYQDDLALQQWAEEFAMQQAQADQAQQNWQKEMDFQREQFEYQKAKAAAGGRSGGRSGGSGGKKKSIPKSKYGFTPWSAEISRKLATGEMTDYEAYNEIMDYMESQNGKFTLEDAKKVIDESGINLKRAEKQESFFNDYGALMDDIMNPLKKLKLKE